MIITGGSLTRKKVTKYGLTGHLTDLAPLTVDRYDHGCGGFYRQDGMQVLMICVAIVCETNELI